MWKKDTIERGRPQMPIWRMRFAYWVPKATDTHSEHIILIAFLLQQWLQCYVIRTLPVLLIGHVNKQLRIETNYFHCNICRHAVCTLQSNSERHTSVHTTIYIALHTAGLHTTLHDVITQQAVQPQCHNFVPLLHFVR